MPVDNVNKGTSMPARVFIGSSSEGVGIATAIKKKLAHAADVVLWSQGGVFGLGDATLEALVRAAEQFDFAVLVLTPDDLTSSRSRKQQSPRDNVLFECGLFMGKLGRHRTFVAFDQSAHIKIPSDLAGITLAGFTGTAVDPAVRMIADAIRKLGPLQPPLPAAWRPFIGNPVRLVLGRFTNIDFLRFERTGTLGAGDAAALAELSSFLKSHATPDTETRFADQLDAADLASNMLLIGGPDANGLTKEVLERTTTKLGVRGIAIVDEQTKREFNPEVARDETIKVDFGAVVSSPNPFSSSHRVIALFGCFGFGTWAAAQFLTRPHIWPNEKGEDFASFETVIKAPIVSGGPQEARVEFLRPLRTRARAAVPYRDR